MPSNWPLPYLPNEAVASGKESFLRWFDAHQADALITLDHPVPSWIQAHIGIKAASNRIQLGTLALISIIHFAQG